MKLAGEAQAELIKLAGIALAIGAVYFIAKRGITSAESAASQWIDSAADAVDSIVTPVSDFGKAYRDNTQITGGMTPVPLPAPTTGSTVGTLAGGYLALENLALSAGEKIRQWWQN